MSDLAYISATDLAARIRAGELTSRAALEFFLDRVAALDGPINSVVTIDGELARAEADEADRLQASGAELGPLHGVPMTIKDSFMTVEMGTTSGAPEFADYVPTEDAWPVAAYREAGAVIYGKTNLPIFAGDFQSYNEVFGTTNNPYDHARTPGGSSGGSAAALACGFTPIELGSDIGGSIRLPAHMSGVVGHKPSYGIVPAHGQIPGPPGTLTLADLAVAGPLARTVDDCELALDLMTGPNRWDTPAWKLELPPARHENISDYRVAVWLDDPHCPVEPESKALLERSAAALADAGATVDHEARPAFTLEKASNTFFALLRAALSGGFSRPKIEEMAQTTGDHAIDEAKLQTSMRHREWLSHNERRLQMRRAFEEFFTDWDVLLMPVMPCVAIEHDHSEPMDQRTAMVGGAEVNYWTLNRWMAPAGACFLPGTVVPVGHTEAGMPVGVQIVGPYLHDRTTLAVGRAIEAALGAFTRPTGF